MFSGMIEPAAVGLMPNVTCPHCWHKFEPHQVLWVSAHPSLMRGDPRLENAPPRFLPTRFAPHGVAYDQFGYACAQLACPRCHLVLPRLALERPPFFVSIVGAPGCGKSYFLASMTWMLRQRLPRWFDLDFTDTDAAMNVPLARMEQNLFGNAISDRLIPLANLVAKTAERGDPYHTVQFDGNSVELPKPYAFTIRPRLSPHDGDPDPSRILYLYDNAGESFLPGMESTLRPVTRHLAESRLLMFLFDPTQHRKCRREIAALGDVATDYRAEAELPRQDLVITEAGNRVRRYAGLTASEKHKQPVVVVVTKMDAWAKLAPQAAANAAHCVVLSGEKGVLNLDRVDETSSQLRELLCQHAPEVVAAAEGFASSVTYIGASALGAPPRRVTPGGPWGVMPDNLAPAGVEVPLLYGLHRGVRRLIDARRSRPAAARRTDDT